MEDGRKDEADRFRPPPSRLGQAITNRKREIFFDDKVNSDTFSILSLIDSSKEALDLLR